MTDPHLVAQSCTNLSGWFVVGFLTGITVTQVVTLFVLGQLRGNVKELYHHHKMHAEMVHEMLFQDLFADPPTQDKAAQQAPEYPETPPQKTGGPSQ